MFITAMLMFAFATVDLSIGLRQNIQAFILSHDAIEEFQKVNSWLFFMKLVDYVVQTFIGDGILIYRCWVTYARKWTVVILPILTWLAGTAVGLLTCYNEAAVAANPTLLNSKHLVPYITSSLCLTLVTNVISTSLIVHRIWTVQGSTPFRKQGGNRLTHSTRILIESGLIYTMSVVVLFVMYLMSNNAQFAVSDAIVQIIGITFNLIIIRVNDSRQVQVINPPMDSRQSNRNSLPLNRVEVLTTIARYQEEAISPPTGPQSSVESKSPADP